jgi:hypothetical protein
MDYQSYEGGGTSNPSALVAPDRQSFNRHLHSKQEVALALGVSLRTLENWMRQKKVPFFRLSPRLVKFDLQRVKGALDKYEVRPLIRPETGRSSS